jgi:hypothetical protein
MLRGQEIAIGFISIVISGSGLTRVCMEGTLVWLKAIPEMTKCGSD